LREIRSNILRDIELKMVDHMDEVLREAIVSEESVLHEVVVPPPTTIPFAEDVRPNVSLS
ncbi:MAG TPA: hypothetical protein VGA95_01465, partial [Thermodesulfobacteriota bacterium]